MIVEQLKFFLGGNETWQWEMPPIHEQLNGKTALRVGFSVAMYDYQMVYTSHGCPSSFITHSARDAYPIWLVVSTHPMLVGNGKKPYIYIYYICKYK